MPEGTRGTLAIYQATLELTRECELHPDLVSQTFGYLFFFSNASLFNTLMEKGRHKHQDHQGSIPAQGGKRDMVG